MEIGELMKKFPVLVHLAYVPTTDGEDDYLCVYTDGVFSMEPGQRCAIYKRIDEGIVRGPKSFISTLSDYWWPCPDAVPAAPVRHGEP
jgi:hypothetical protein